MDNTTPAASTAGSQRDAQSIREDFYHEIAQITEQAGGHWAYLNGTAFTPEDRGSFAPKQCASGDDSARQLLLLLTSGPSTDGPKAIEHMRSVLEGRGMKVTGYIPGKTEREASTISAESPTGQFVSYGTNDQRTTVRFGSECSSHPTMLQDVD